MILFAWIVRVLLFFLLLPFLLPLGIIFAAIFVSPLSFALFVLALVLLVLGVVLGVALGVIGNLVDLLIVLGLIGLLWKWPRGIEGRFSDKVRLSYRRLRNTIREQVRACTASDLALCLVIILIAIVLSLSSGFLHFVFTVGVVLAVVGVVWKWPRSPHLRFFVKLRIALQALRDELRRIFR
jgi:hypothetical protein